MLHNHAFGAVRSAGAASISDEMLSASFHPPTIGVVAIFALKLTPDAQIVTHGHSTCLNLGWWGLVLALKSLVSESMGALVLGGFLLLLFLRLLVSLTLFLITFSLLLGILLLLNPFVLLLLFTILLWWLFVILLSSLVLSILVTLFACASSLIFGSRHVHRVRRLLLVDLFCLILTLRLIVIISKVLCS